MSQLDCTKIYAFVIQERVSGWDFIVNVTDNTTCNTAVGLSSHTKDKFLDIIAKIQVRIKEMR